VKVESSLCEKPERHAPRRLSDYLVLEGQMQKVHSLVDKVYSRKNLKFAWERVRANQGASGTDGVSIEAFAGNILLTPFDKEMRRQGYQLTRWADDWVVTCRTRAEAEHALARAVKILDQLGVTLNREKTRIVHITHGFEFLGFKIKRGKGRFKLPHGRIKSKLHRQNFYAIPTQKAVGRFKDQIRACTQRRVSLRMGELIKTINPIIRGWGNYYCRSQVRKRFAQ
jgi:RNA-directed DNA polymerase